LIRDAIGVARENYQVAFRFTEKESVFIDTGNGRAPDCLVVAANFLQLILDPILARHVLHDADTLHKISNHDHIVNNRDIDGRSRCPIGGELFELECARVVINRLVDNDLGTVSSLLSLARIDD
jgi:hypothetical protein